MSPQRRPCGPRPPSRYSRCSTLPRSTVAQRLATARRCCSCKRLSGRGTDAKIVRSFTLRRWLVLMNTGKLIVYIGTAAFVRSFVELRSLRGTGYSSTSFYFVPGTWHLVQYDVCAQLRPAIKKRQFGVEAQYLILCLHTSCIS